MCRAKHVSIMIFRYLRFWALFVIFAAFTATGSAHAQVPALPSSATPTPAAVPPQPRPAPIKPFAGIILNEQMPQAQLENNFYVIPDAEKNLSVRLVTEKVTTGNMNEAIARSHTVNLGLDGMTYWIVIPITNVSSSELWELDLGDSYSGRLTFLSRFSIYSSFSNKVVFDSAPSEQSAYSISNKLRLSIPVGQSGFLVIEARNPSGSVSTLSMELKRAYHSDTSSALHVLVMARIPLITAIILLTAFAIRRQWSFGIFGLAWFLIYLHSYMVDHYVFISGFSAQLFTPAMWLVISLLLIAAFWLSEKIRDEFPSSLFTGLGFMCLIFGLISLLITDFMPIAGSILSYGPLGIASAVMIVLGIPIALREQQRSYLALMLSGVCFLIGMLCIGLVAFHVSSQSGLLLNGAYIAFCAAAPFTALFAILSTQGPVAIPALRDQEDSLPVFKGGLAEAKENSEHKRLLQVLEQERATMAQMQVQEARRTEEMRKAKEAADEANNAKSAFLAVVSHEIRTPMTGIMGMVRLMLDTNLSKDQKEYATTIQDSGEALMALLNDILDFEKIESGKLELERVDFDLHRLLRGIQTLMNGHAASKGVELKLELDPKVPPFVIGDPTRLRQILLNLVNNAIKFTSKGAVYLRINDLTPEDKLNGPVHQIYFAVQDSGIGISPEVQKRLFMPFAQADSSTSRKYGGTGLGLAICKRLIEVMGGGINISSKPNEGSTFFFTLGMPLGQEGMAGNFAAAAAGITEPHAPKAPARSLTVLVVDDNGINQKVLTGLIEKDGHKVVTASTGAEALGKYLAATYDLVLMDLELPDKNGLEVTHDIRMLRDPAKAFVPVVAMTGNTSEKDVAACFAAGMDDFLGKPITPEKLKSILAKAGGDGTFANHVQKELRSSSAASIAATPPSQPVVEHDYVPMPPPSSGSAASPLAPAVLPEAPGFTFDLPGDEEEEDTFESAIKQYETMEQNSTRIDSDLDEVMLSSLKGSLNAAQMEDLLASFYEKAEELVTAIGQSYLQNDLPSLASRAHELKGMAGNFGFKGVSALAGQIEKAAKDKNEPELKAPVERIAETYALSKARLVAWLAG